MKTLLTALAMAAALTIPACADDEIAFATPSDPVAGHAETTYADLIKQVIPDFTLNADHDWTGTLPDGVRHIEGPGSVGETPDPVKISYVDVRELDAEGRKTMWVMADLGDGGNLGTYTLLMLFDDSTMPKLLDAAEVDTDGLTGFIDVPVRISPHDEAIMVDSEHSNSSQTYQALTLLFAHGGKLTKIDGFFAFGTRSCTYHQYEQVDVTAKPSGKGFWPIRAVNTRRVGKYAETACPDEDGKLKAKTFSAVYTWNARTGRYETMSKELTRLAKADGALF